MKWIGRQKKEDQVKEFSETNVSSERIHPVSEGSKCSPIRSTVIVRPLVTEKTARLAGMGKYVFEVTVTAGRVEIQQAIANIYGVRPVSVNIQNVVSRAVRFGRHRGFQKAWKKAIVTLPKGKKIDVHEGV